MSKSFRHSCSHIPTLAQRNNRRALQKLPASQPLAEEKDQDPPSKSSQSTTYDLVTLFAMMGGFIHWEPFFICLSCLMAIASRGPSITQNILQLIKAGILSKKPNSP